MSAKTNPNYEKVRLDLFKKNMEKTCKDANRELSL
jgi:hypothetical protein